MRTIVIGILCASFALPMAAQDKRRQRADELFEQFAYMEAAALYEKIIRGGDPDSEVLRRLGDAYYLNARYTEAADWYGQLLATQGDQPAIFFFRYSQALRAKGQPEMAEQMLTAYRNIASTPLYTAFLEHGFQTPGVFSDQPPQVEVYEPGINSPESEFGGIPHEGGLVFTSSREIPGAARRRFLWTNSAFTNLFFADTSANGSYTDTREFLREVNSRFNESSPAFSPDGNTLYFTRNNMQEGDKRADELGLVRLKIYRVEKVDGKWGEVTELPFNDDAFSCAHPALSPSGDTLYFASDRPGGYGQSDLYRVALNEDGQIGEPENLGPAVNTPARETFPFISSENELFFASDGHQGLGGLDLFVCAPRFAPDTIAVLNLGTPFNSPWDDFAFVLDRVRLTGFFSSNRDGGQGNDDIYGFRIRREMPTESKEEPIARLWLQGQVTDTVNHKAVVGVSLHLLDAVTQDEIARTTTDERGLYRIELPNRRYFELRSEVSTHRPRVELFDRLELSASGDTLSLNLELTPVQDARVLARINEIYFDFDDHAIRPDAAAELDKVVRLMLLDYPEMTIRIESHTDPLGDHKYNDRLSQLRAASTYNYLVAQGVPAERILSFRGFGKRRPLNDCQSLEDCTEEELGLNRRTVLPIVQISSGIRFETANTVYPDE